MEFEIVERWGVFFRKGSAKPIKGNVYDTGSEAEHISQWGNLAFGTNDCFVGKVWVLRKVAA